MTPTERWNDDRLDDFYEEFRRMSLTVERIGAMEVSLESAARDCQLARTGLHNLRSDVTAQFIELRNDMMTAATAAAAERKTDKRWYVGTALTATALIIAAVGIIVSAVG